MKSKLNLIWLLALGIALNPVAYAADDDDATDDDTMTVVEEGESEEGVMEYVEHIAPNENAERGTRISNAARNPDTEEQGRDFGQWVSEQVKTDTAALRGDNASAAADVRADAATQVLDNARRDAKGNNGRRPDDPGRP
jgi:hypothetical protein